jgi:DNA polymerase-3 subunit epsilon
VSAAVQQRFDDLGTPLIDVEFVVLDLETTGGSPTDDRVTEVGAVKIRGGEVIGTFQTLVDPEVPIPPFISALTGLTDRMVAGAEPIEVILPCLVEFLGTAVLVAHNAPFDTRFLQANLERHGYRRMSNRVVCTARLARKLLPREELPSVRLGTLAAYLGAATVPCHRAMPDARATVEVFHSLLERAGSFGVLTLEDLLEFPKARACAAFKKVHLADGLPHAPGVYLFRDKQGRVLYVGKAKDLRARVRSYFSGDGRSKVAELVRELAAIDHLPCASELEAGVREVRLIQRHRPRYNRRSRNPERYCYLKVTRERFPRLSLVRKVLGDGARYLGPFGSSGQAELVKSAIEDALPLRRCTSKLGPRVRLPACALLELDRCLGPCGGGVPEAAYAAVVASLEAALEGGDPEPLLAPLRRRMAAYAAEQRYEQAAAARDRLEALSRALAESRRTATLLGTDELVLAMPRRAGSEVTVIRGGQLVAAAVLPAGDQQALARLLAGAAAAEPFEGPPPRHLADEIRLVTGWLDAVAGKAEVLSIRGRLASPWIGGASLQVRYDPRRGHHQFVPGEARGRPEARPSRPRRRGAPRETRWPRRDGGTRSTGAPPWGSPDPSRSTGAPPWGSPDPSGQPTGWPGGTGRSGRSSTTWPRGS